MVVLGICSSRSITVGQSFFRAVSVTELDSHRLGPTPLAAQSVLLVSSSTAFQTPYSLGMATTVRVGNLLGSGHAKMAKLAAETAIGMSLVVAMVLRYSLLIPEIRPRSKLSVIQARFS